MNWKVLWGVCEVLNLDPSHSLLTGYAWSKYRLEEYHSVYRDLFRWAICCVHSRTSAQDHAVVSARDNSGE